MPFEEQNRTDAGSSIMVSINIHLRKKTHSQYGVLSSLLKYRDDGRLVVKYTDGDVMIGPQACQATDIYRFHVTKRTNSPPPYSGSVLF